jgi:peptidoglycan/LPS O-acetylase OafA/YrhL
MLYQRLDNKLSLRESAAISHLRMVSCMMIVLCHFLQAYGNDIAYIFNTGVQIFLIISGYLYGVKRIKSAKSFYFGRIMKVYKPYVIWTILVAIILLCISPAHISIKRLCAQLLLLGFIDGQTHLWFLPVLISCYLILPIFDAIKKLF